MRADRSGRSVGVLVLAAWLILSLAAPAGPAAAPAALPERLSDAEFWKIVTDFSEPGGYFRITDNFTSNEREIGALFTMLRAANVKGGVYMGVGPEQNLTYIAAIRPAMAFIVDIRRQAVVQHLMFKAVFEMSKDRADFISLLFSKPRPAGLESTTPIQKLWAPYLQGPSDGDMAHEDLRAHRRAADQDARLHPDAGRALATWLRVSGLSVLWAGHFDARKRWRRQRDVDVRGPHRVVVRRHG